MDNKIEFALCMNRIEAVNSANKQLADELLEIGYPNEYPEKFRTLETAYKNLRNAAESVVCEELKIIESLK